MAFATCHERARRVTLGSLALSMATTSSRGSVLQQLPISLLGMPSALPDAPSGRFLRTCWGWSVSLGARRAYTSAHKDFFAHARVAPAWPYNDGMAAGNHLLVEHLCSREYKWINFEACRCSSIGVPNVPLAQCCRVRTWLLQPLFLWTRSLHGRPRQPAVPGRQV